jgi:hypothetical protein
VFLIAIFSPLPLLLLMGNFTGWFIIVVQTCFSELSKSRGFVDHPCHNSILRFSDCCLHRSDDFLNLDIEEMHLLKIDEERYNYIPHTPSLISWRKFQ